MYLIKNRIKQYNNRLFSILIYLVDAQEPFLIIINVENGCAA